MVLAEFGHSPIQTPTLRPFCIISKIAQWQRLGTTVAAFDFLVLAGRCQSQVACPTLHSSVERHFTTAGHTALIPQRSTDLC